MLHELVKSLEQRSSEVRINMSANECAKGTFYVSKRVTTSLEKCEQRSRLTQKVRDKSTETQRADKHTNNGANADPVRHARVP